MSLAEALLPPRSLASLDTSELDALQPARTLIERVAAALRRSAGDGVLHGFDLTPLDAANLRLIEEVLGQGEVSARSADLQIQEAVMPGVWRVRGDGIDRIETGAIPEAVRSAAATAPRQSPLLPENLPEGAMNIRPVLFEIGERMAARQPGDEAHEVNLTLLPMSPVDLAVLADALGEHEVTLLSRGYGNCRIDATACRDVWRLRFFNADDKMILDCVQVGDVPQAAQAAAEDLEDSAQRLDEILAAYFT